MKIIAWILLMPMALMAQLSYTELETMLKESDEAAIRAEIQHSGINFDINRSSLKRMKTDQFPIWLIDYLVLRDYDRQHPEAYAGYDDDGYSPYGYDYGYSPYYYDYYGPMTWWDLALAGPLYAGFWNPWYFWGSYPIYHGVYGPNFHLPGNRLSPNRYRNAVDGRVVGRARPRGNGPKASSSGSARSGRSSSATRSSGGKVSRSGYHRNRN